MSINILYLEFMFTLSVHSFSLSWFLCLLSLIANITQRAHSSYSFLSSFIDDQEVPRGNHFGYLGSISRHDGMVILFINSKWDS